MRYTYRVDGEPDILIGIEADNPTGAAIKAGQFGQKHKMLLLGPIELAHEKVYE